MSKPPSHRGAAPEDNELFEPRHWPAMRAALSDLIWLLERGYSSTSALELVGNHYELTRRQRLAVSRCAATTAQVSSRLQSRMSPEQLRGQNLWVDGFNVLMAIEVALSGGVLLLGCDGCYRDVAGVHGRYRRVTETLPALELIGRTLAECGVRECRWYLDSPVSNSGRLKTILRQIAGRNGWNWEVELVFSPDKILAESKEIVATADSAILDRCQRWVNLAGLVLQRQPTPARVVELRCGQAGGDARLV